MHRLCSIQVMGHERVAPLCCVLPTKTALFFCRHTTLPNEVAGISRLRTRMAWQRVEDVSKVKSAFPRDSAQFQIAPEVSPLPTEVVFDKITMSAFEGTFLNIALRDCGINAISIVGVAMEVGIEPAVLHAADLAYVPVLVTDACGAGNEKAAEHSLESLRFAGNAVMTDVETFVSVLERTRKPRRAA